MQCLPFPTSAPEPMPRQYAEAVSRLASVRHALRLVDGFGGGPASDADNADIAAAWNETDKAKRRAFDGKSTQLVGAAAAGLEALLTGARRDVSRIARRIANWSSGSAASWWMSPASSSKTRPGPSLSA